MEKEFFDVFPNLKLKQELSELLEEVIVTKVACNSAKTCVRVYLKSDRWIHKKHIFSLEEQIQRQCFPGLEVSVKVIEKFHLSRQYTPKNFLDTYRSSMELELRNYNMLEYNLFKQAQITFPEDDCLNMVLPDSVISRQKSEILIEYLHKVFCERCGMDSESFAGLCADGGEQVPQKCSYPDPSGSSQCAEACQTFHRRRERSTSFCS